jgi:SAM-dependent methyltransferase
MNPYFTPIKEAIERSLEQDIFVKLTLGNYKGSEEHLKSVQVKRILIKKEPKLSFTYRYQRRDIVKNYDFKDAILLIDTLVDVQGFRLLTLFTTAEDIVLVHKKGENWLINPQKPTYQNVPSLDHDKTKHRKITSQSKPYLQALNITDADGNVFKNAQDKYKQINHYVEILSSLLNQLPNRPQTNVVDMGAGKGYLTFALYDYLNNVIQKPAAVVGVEFRKDLVDLCNKIGVNSGFEQLQFVEGTIDDYQNSDIHVLIALHACDTATDDAIYKGIMANADLIVVAPCCHKQIRREIEKHKTQNSLDFLTKYGVFLERQAEMLTDGLRALLLEYHGYSTKVLEFVSDAHTPKNVLIVGQKKQKTAANQKQILAKIQEIKTFFGIEYHHLEQKLGLK